MSKVKLTGYGKTENRKVFAWNGAATRHCAGHPGDPQLLIMDEPTSGLDPAGRKEVRDLIFSLKAAGKTIFLSSHILSEVNRFATRQSSSIADDWCAKAPCRTF